MRTPGPEGSARAPWRASPELERKRQDDAVGADRRSMVGSGEHRIQLTLHKLDRFLDGALEDVIVPLRTHHRAERLRRELGIETGVTTAAMGGDD